MKKVRISITSKDKAELHQVLAPHGAKLRDVLLENGFSPYSRRNLFLNCKGLNICGTCKVIVEENGQAWERRSCQIQCFHDLEIQLQ